jgi:hypothetical protein
LPEQIEAAIVAAKFQLGLANFRGGSVRAKSNGVDVTIGGNNGGSFQGLLTDPVDGHVAYSASM